MKDSKEFKKRRPLSHIQLLVFPNNSEYIMDNPKEYLKEPQRKEKFSLQNLHEKWKRKGNVNFNPIDYKFDFKKSPSVKKSHKTEEEEKQQKQFFDILHGIYYDASDYVDNKENKSQKSYIKNNNKSKYNSKNSYYLTAKNPWNNNSVFDTRDRKNMDKKIIINMKEAHKTNQLINSQNKNYKSIKERYLRENYLIKEAKRNKFIEAESNKLYTKIMVENPGIEKYPEKANALLLKGMINLYQDYSKYIEEKNSNKKKRKNNNGQINKFMFNENKFKNKNIRTKHAFTDIEIFDKLQILLAYLKENKSDIDHKKFLQPLIIDYNRVMEKEEYLKKLDEEYQKYVEEKKKEEESEQSKINILNVSKYPINEKVEREKIRNVFSYHKINQEEPKEENDENKKINYFLSAYKAVFDEKNTKVIKKRGNPIIITERSTNPFGTYDKLTNNNNENLEEIKNNNYNADNNNKNKKRRPNSSYGTRRMKITYYHPGSYFLFQEPNNEYHTWSCCLNEDKFSKGCSKKVEKVLSFNYNDNV